MIYDLTIESDTTTDLSSQSIALVAPAQNSTTGSTEIDFLWEHLSGVNNYRIQVGSPDFSNSTFIQVDEYTGNDFYTAILPEGDYLWRVRGENDNSVTPYSEYAFSIDLTGPDQPILISPILGDTVFAPANLVWEVANDAVEDSIFIYSDATLNDLIQSAGTTATSYNFTGALNTTYFWQVKSVDAVGNVGAASATGNFYLE